MRRLNSAQGFLAVLVVLTCACESPVETDASRTEISLVVVSGNGQTGAVGTELPEPLVVRVTRGQRGVTVGVPLQLVNFRVVAGGGSVFAGSAITDQHGFAREYWTLGLEPGANSLEVRSVDPSTGAKQVHGRFEAAGVIPGPEVCNGLDDNLDGAADDPTWRYCSAGVPAPNTDGENSCAAHHLDLNAVAADGCERLVGGTWELSPILRWECPVPIFGTFTFTVSSVAMSSTSPNQLHFNVPLSWPLGSTQLDFDIPVESVTEHFGASTSFNSGGDHPASGTLAIDGRFTGGNTLEATVDLQMTLSGEACTDLHQTVIATRLGS